MTVSIVVPSRGRPDRLAKMWATAQHTALDDIEMCVYLDADDPTLLEYTNGSWRRNVTAIVGPRKTLSIAWNEAAKAAKGELLLMAGDDLEFRTAGWDRILTERGGEGDGIWLLHTRDGYQDERLATHPTLTRGWYDKIGMLCPPYFTADYNDTWLTEVARMTGRVQWVPEVLIEHMHPAAGKSEMDETYEDQRRRWRDDGMEALYANLFPVRVEWAQRLR